MAYQNETGDLADTNPEYTLRFLNTPLSGCEYELIAGVTRILVGPEEALFDNESEYDQVVVPYGNTLCHFLLRVDATKSAILLISEQGSEQLLSGNQETEACGVRFAIKLPGEEWDIKALKKELDPKKRSVVVTAFLSVGMLCIIALCIMLFSMDDDQKQSKKIRAVVAAELPEARVVDGKDKQHYILTESHQEQVWLTQALRKKTDLEQKLFVLNINKEEEKIYLWFKKNRPGQKVHALNLDKEGIARITSSSERSQIITPQQAAEVTLHASDSFPYIKKVSFHYISDQAVVQDAINAISKITQKYDVLNNKDNVSLNLYGERNDNELLLLQTQINAFNQRWKTDYVQIVITLSDEWLRDKSYIYGKEGFVKMSSLHWFFPNKNQSTIPQHR